MRILKKITLVLTSAIIVGQTAPVAIAIAENPPNSEVCVGYADTFGDIISGAEYTIMVRLSGKFITAKSDGNVHQWEKLDDDSQKWQIVAVGKNLCKIVLSSDTSLALTVENGDSTNGNNIFLSEYKDTSAQHFILHRTDDAYYITAECSGNAALDVYDISYENGANIDQWDYWAGEGQKFYIRPTNSEYSLLKGDLDVDGKVDVFDRVLMQKGCNTSFDEVAEKIADMNENGFVTSEDGIALSENICGKPPQTESFSKIGYSKPDTAYLFAYFNGNAPEQERLSYAVSTDGYHYTALNGGKSVWQSSVGTKCLRDPYIFKGEDGLYHLLATDMKSSLGWNSNRNLLSAKSTDLVHWFDETSIEIADKYANMAGADRAWAPQAIFDPEKNSYMIYFAARVPNIDNRTIMYYAYSKDLKTLDTAPQLLFAPQNGNDAIDSDIIFQNGKYYMYYKNETNKRIYLATASHAAGPYTEVKQISEGSLGVEGPNIFNIIGTNEWLMMSDAYGDGYYVMQKTSDFTNFTTVPKSSYSFDFTPRHGYVIPISTDQYNALISAFNGNSPIINTGVNQPSIRLKVGDKLEMPKNVTARYSDGGTAAMAVNWNSSDVAAIDTSKKGTYTVSGEVQTADYANPFINERADPFVTDGGDGYYYFTASFPAYGSVDKGYDRIILRRSQTVGGLASAEEKVIWKAHSSGELAKHIWAPEMHKINGVWYIFFAAGRSDDIWAIRPYVLKCSGDPYNGNWTECGRMQASYGDNSSFASFSLDMTYFENNGKHYVIWAEIKGDSSLFMAEINPDEPWKLTSKPIMLTKPEFSWELVNNRVNEGATVLKANGKIYVFFSASGTGSEYCVGRLEIDEKADLMNISNWKKLDYPVLSTANLNGESGPGHNCFVTDEKGRLLVVYHARPSSHSSKNCGTFNADPLYDPCRHTRIRQVYFAADGSPVISMKNEDFLNQNNKKIKAKIVIE